MPGYVGVLGKSLITPAPGIPSTIGGLNYWYDASDTTTITHSAGAVSQWDDKSGNGIHLTQPTGTKQPATGTVAINSKNVIDFDGSTDQLYVAQAAPSLDYTIFVVLRPDVIGEYVAVAHRVLAGGIPIVNQVGITSLKATLDHRTDSNVLTRVTETTNWTAGQTRLLVGTKSGAAMTLRHIYNNGYTITSGTANTTAVTTTALYVGAVADTVWWNGQIAEIIRYNTTLSDTDRITVEDYLLEKWLPITAPDQVSGLQLWLDADDAATFTYSSGDVVSQWNDKSGNARHATQATVANQPTRSGTINGRPTVVLDGTDDTMSGGLPTAAIDNVTMFVVCDETGGGTERVPFFNGIPPTNGYGIATDVMAASTNLGWFRGQLAWHTSTTPKPAGQMILTLQRAAGTWNMYLDGAVLSGTSSTLAPNVPTGQYYVGSPNHLFGGHVAEVLMYDQALTPYKRQAVETYLKKKWFYVSITDDFNRADGAVGSNWTEDVGTFAIASNQLDCVTVVGQGVIHHNTPTYTADQYVQVKLSETSSTTGVLARLQDFNTFYMGRWATNWQIYKRIGGAFTLLAETVEAAPAVPYTVRLEVQGNELRLYHNGVLKVTATDPDITTPKLTGLRSLNANAVYDDFAAGDL